MGLGRDQAAAYLRLLELSYLRFALPAWSTNLTSRVTKRPKLHLVDSGLAAHLQGVTAEQLRPTDPVGAARFGPLPETFVVTDRLPAHSRRHPPGASGTSGITAVIVSSPGWWVNTGSQSQQVDDRIWVAPVDGLWTA